MANTIRHHFLIVARLGAVLVVFLGIGFFVKSPPVASAQSTGPATGDQSLLTAARQGDKETIKKCITSGADLNVRDARGNTPLHLACIYGHIEIAKLLLAAKADYEIMTNEEISPLFTASFFCNVDMVKLLLAHGADATTTDKNGTPLVKVMAAQWEVMQGIYQAICPIVGVEFNAKHFRETRPIVHQLLGDQLVKRWDSDPQQISVHSGRTKEPTASEWTVSDVRATHNRHYTYDKSHSPDYLFDQNALRRYDIYVEDEDLAFLKASPVREKYVEGALLFEGQLVTHVGVRYKGEHGSFEGFVEDFQSDPISSGPKIASKLSIKVKFNWENKKGEFFGVKKLQFHSMNHDRSMMRERLYWHLLASFGNPVPRCVHAKVYINDVYSGIYALTEQIDGRFTNHHFEDGDGNLYKSVWPIEPDDTLKPESILKDALKTNEEEGDVSQMKLFATEILGASPPDIDSIVALWFDVDKLVRLYVVMNVLGHKDSAIFGGVGFGASPNGNFYWYVEAKNKRVHLIPWDMDQEIGGPGYVGNGSDYWRRRFGLMTEEEADLSEIDKAKDEESENGDGSPDEDARSDKEFSGPSRDKLVLAIRAQFSGERYEERYEDFLKNHYNSEAV